MTINLPPDSNRRLSTIAAIAVVASFVGCVSDKNKTDDPYVDRGFGGFNRDKFDENTAAKQRETERLRESTEKVNREIAEVNARNGEIESRLKAAQEALASVGNPAAEKLQRIAALQREQKAIEAELTSLQGKSSSPIEDRQKRITELKRKNDELWNAALVAVAP